MSSTIVLASGAGASVRRPQRDSLGDEELAAAARDKDAGLYQDAQAAELGPANDLLQRQADDTAVHHVL